uniref:T9SS type A sorting domain-containing protein n=1 Tax=candidate division WOR-3 bacterium TaxID=2052148 RepID=A0A7C4XLV4_UNCW3
MKKIIVLFFFLLFAHAEWQQQEEIALPKNLQVNDLSFSPAGELFLLTSSALLKLEADSRNFVLVQEVKNGKLIAVGERTVYLVDAGNRISIIQTAIGETNELPISLNTPQQISLIQGAKRNFLIIREPNRLIFTDGTEVLGTLNVISERFNTVFKIENDESEIPILTLTNNKISLWQGGGLKNSLNYKTRIIYTSSGEILDFASIDLNRIYILLSDSIVVLDTTQILETLPVEKVSMESRILINPVNNNLFLFNPQLKTIKIYSPVKREKTDIITLKKNWPNPVDNYTEIEFTLGEPLDLTLTIYNLIGEPVKVLARGRFNKGTHILAWHADDENGNLVPNGVYFYRLETKKGVAIKQLIVLR